MPILVIEELETYMFDALFPDGDIYSRGAVHYALDAEKWMSNQYDYPKPRCGQIAGGIGTRDISKVSCLKCRKIVYR